MAAVPITLPSHSTLFTGLYPPAHGVRDNGIYKLPDEVQTLAEQLKADPCFAALHTDPRFIAIAGQCQSQ